MERALTRSQILDPLSYRKPPGEATPLKQHLSLKAGEQRWEEEEEEEERVELKHIHPLPDLPLLPSHVFILLLLFTQQ